MVKPVGTGTQTKGTFVVGFLTAVGDISQAFEPKLTKILAENGIENPREDETYPAGAVIASINQLAEDIGPNTTHQIGVKQVTVPEWPPDINSIEDGMAALNDMYDEAYVNPDEALLGRFHYEQTGDSSGRGAVTKNFPYPPAFARGIFEGIIKELGPSNAFPRISETEPRADEKAAFELHW